MLLFFLWIANPRGSVFISGIRLRIWSGPGATWSFAFKTLLPTQSSTPETFVRKPRRKITTGEDLICPTLLTGKVFPSSTRFKKHLSVLCPNAKQLDDRVLGVSWSADPFWLTFWVDNGKSYFLKNIVLSIDNLLSQIMTINFQNKKLMWPEINLLLLSNLLNFNSQWYGNYRVSTEA